MNCANPECGAFLRTSNKGPLCDPCLNSGVGNERLRFVRRILQENWTRDALCKELGRYSEETWAPTWFPERNSENREASTIRRERMAMRYCALCPVRFECLTSAYEHEEHYGIWGGVTALTIQRDLGGIRRATKDRDERQEMVGDMVLLRLAWAQRAALAGGYIGDDEVEEAAG